MDERTVSVWSDARMRWGVLAVVFLLAAFLAMLTLSEIRAFQYIGGGVPVSNTVTVQGEGEVFAVPDIATFTFGVTEQADTVQEAQETATEKVNAVLAYVRDEGIPEEDIRTIGYNVYPRYEYIQDVCTEFRCPPGRQELLGFEVSQNIEVKVRRTAEAGALLSGVGERGANTVSGLNFTIDDEDELMRQAREKAIEDARQKARQLADDLNVRLVRVVSFNESNGGMPMPYYGYEKLENRVLGMGGATSDAAMPAPDVPTGENRLMSYVTITYEIR